MVDLLALAGAVSVVAVVVAALYELRRNSSRRQRVGALVLAVGYATGIVAALGSPAAWLPAPVGESLSLVALALLLLGVSLYRIDREAA
ncbi:hypothetical protein [Natranaeroarchaeum sulfidigenes]|uniref:Uncharacterized protein n=1 Tax=Natranaeroarchaeum sulfidigenes TaxID=2784880 RepID=A0A897MLD4_9EURY|nr:hypothetical protein [Natranaeroarchaeum sulfidigenes]QSG01404.1 hypothetical protein AArcS_0164 [Natranaeroarchaeum sulfidigenes]